MRGGASAKGAGTSRQLLNEIRREPTPEELGEKLRMPLERVRRVLNGHPRPTDLAWIAVAKSLCGASDWHRASRVPGPGARVWRGAPATNTFFLCGLLQ